MTLEMDYLSQRFIILSLIFMGIIGVMFGYAYLVKLPAQEEAYQTNKPTFDLKSCSDLEKIINYSTDQWQVFFAQRNYNERCLSP